MPVAGACADQGEHALEHGHHKGQYQGVVPQFNNHWLAFDGFITWETS